MRFIGVQEVVSDGIGDVYDVVMQAPHHSFVANGIVVHNCEELGGVKQDWLGLRHLDTLSVARQLIYARHGVWLDFDRTGLSVPQGCTHVIALTSEHFSDPAIWELIDQGHTIGVFQMETPNLAQATIEFKPRNEVDVAALTSIVRPGVADAGLKDVYLRRRAGLEPVVYDHPLMEPITAHTCGVLVYQESMVECVQQLAGFTADEADDLRKSLGKKLMDKILGFKNKFIQGCLSNLDFVRPWHHEPWASLDAKTEQKCQAVAETIWASIEAAGNYAFNYSHAVAYAHISTAEVWVKYHYPQEFLVALMVTDSGNISRYLREARRLGIEIRPPDINRSQRKFSIEDQAIRYGIDTVRGVAEKVSHALLKAQPYTSLTDYLRRAGKAADLGVVYNLILIGAFDGFATCDNGFDVREELLSELQHYRITKGLAESTLTNPARLETVVTRRLASGNYIIEVPDFDNPQQMGALEKHLIGTYLRYDPMQRYASALDECALRDPVDLYQVPVGTTAIIGGQLAEVRKTVTKKGRSPGQEMAHLTVQYNDADFRIVAFPDSWQRCRPLLQTGAPVACRVKRLDQGASLETVERLDLLFDRAGIT